MSEEKLEEKRLNFLYEKAIEGRKHHQENFNHWMNMYAIFNGALFIGYYNMPVVAGQMFKMLIVFLGCVAGWAWYFSLKGFYSWIISWIQLVKKREEKLDELYMQDCNAVVYRFYEGRKTTSTQKVTKLFTFLTALAWSVLLAENISQLIVYHWYLLQTQKGIFFVFALIAILCFVVIFYLLTLESDFESKEVE